MNDLFQELQNTHAKLEVSWIDRFSDLGTLQNSLELEWQKTVLVVCLVKCVPLPDIFHLQYLNICYYLVEISYNVNSENLTLKINHCLELITLSQYALCYRHCLQLISIKVALKEDILYQLLLEAKGSMSGVTHIW